MYLCASQGRDVTPLARANWIGWLMIPAAIQSVFYLRDENSKAARIAGALLYPFWILILCLSISTELIEPGNYTLIPYVDRSGPLGKPLRVLGIMQLCWLMYELFRLRLQVSGIKRAQLNYFMYGMLIFTGGGTMVAGILPLISGSAIEPGLGSYFGLPWVVLSYYAITRDRLFDLRLVASRTISIALLTLLFSAVHLGLFSLFEPVLGQVLAILISLSIICALLFGTRLNRKLQKWIRHIIVGHTYDYQNVLRESIKAISTILALDELLEFIIASVRRSLDAESGCLFLKAADGHYRLRQGFGAQEKIALNNALDDDLARWMKLTGKIVIREELEAAGPGEEPRVVAAFCMNSVLRWPSPSFQKASCGGC